MGGTKDDDVLYLCDPQKNTKCKKTICQSAGGCFLTTIKAFSKLDENGAPIVSTELLKKLSFRK